MRPLEWSVAAPLLCAVHCLMTPLLVAAMPVLGLSAGVEWLWFGATVPLALITTTRAIRQHARRRAALPVVAGLSLWGLALTGLGSAPWSEACHIAGGLMTAFGMLWNARLRHRACRAGDASLTTHCCQTHA